MNGPDTAPLMVSQARVLRPQDVVDVGQWAGAVEEAYAHAEESLCREVAELWYSQLGQHPAELAGIDRPEVAAQSACRFRWARSKRQLDLAGEAMQLLFETLSEKVVAERCRLAIFSASSLDESSLFHSLIGNLVRRAGIPNVPHFALSQLQGASFAGATAIIDAMVQEPGSGALFIAAEAWPTAFPRAFDLPTVLGDGSVVLWFTRSDSGPGLQYLGGLQRSFAPFVREAPGAERLGLPADFPEFRLARPSAPGAQGFAEARRRVPAAADARRGMSLDRAALLDAAESTASDCLALHGFSANDVSGWIPSGLDGALEEELRSRLGVRAPFAARPLPDDGYWSAAASPLSIADALNGVRSGELSDGALLFSWGASFGSGIGTQLWRAVGAKQSLQLPDVTPSAIGCCSG